MDQSALGNPRASTGILTYTFALATIKAAAKLQASMIIRKLLPLIHSKKMFEEIIIIHLPRSSYDTRKKTLVYCLARIIGKSWSKV